MIDTVQKLEECSSTCTKCLDDKLAGADGKRHIVLCGGTGCLSSNSMEIKEKFEKLLEEKGLSDKATVNIVGCFGFCSQDLSLRFIQKIHYIVWYLLMMLKRSSRRIS